MIFLNSPIILDIAIISGIRCRAHHALQYPRKIALFESDIERHLESDGGANKEGALGGKTIATELGAFPVPFRWTLLILGASRRACRPSCLTKKTQYNKLCNGYEKRNHAPDATVIGTRVPSLRIAVATSLHFVQAPLQPRSTRRSTFY